ncbi:hypothetical protein K504DRAFT_486531 [Pleomassaria siparia CBS 279.74]|uniref:Uncharacterized protein n=1 Tax=Pleomassaria siparia CBS 279.74 TaxID=1314801 RepID=A0A6G1KPC5_9PLEO|nr:hypothetical protein K504DRAFT_486531 [Pleomassaria siparia CBS 279.74]
MSVVRNSVDCICSDIQGRWWKGGGRERNTYQNDYEGATEASSGKLLRAPNPGSVGGLMGEEMLISRHHGHDVGGTEFQSESVMMIRNMSDSEAPYRTFKQVLYGLNHIQSQYFSSSCPDFTCPAGSSIPHIRPPPLTDRGDRALPRLSHISSPLQTWWRSLSITFYFNSCAAGARESCTPGIKDNVKNFMDYTDCSSEFTPCQGGRMMEAWSWRSGRELAPGVNTKLDANGQVIV